MKFTQLAIADVWLIEPELIEDNRGEFGESLFLWRGWVSWTREIDFNDHPSE